jgi:CubicO group peptidase (beta-lactamase class C family)
LKVLKRVSLVLLVVVLATMIYMAVNFLPIMTGMAAKTMCSCVYVMQRDPESVTRKELTVFPGLSSANITFHQDDSSVTASLLGRESKAIFRKGLGCTLLAERSEQELRQQKFDLPDAPAATQNTVRWPSGDVKSDTLPAGVNYRQIKEAVDSAFVDIDPGKPIRTHAVMVVYDGQIIGEKYAPGFTRDSRMMGWSMTKSITNALIGILVKEGKLNIEQPAPIPEWRNDDRHQITINHLLQASSGLKWSESYFFPGDFHNMFIHSDDKGGYAARRKLKYKPNEHFAYSSGTTNILSKIIRQTVGDKDYYRFAYEKLFYKIGMNHTLLEPDASGTFVGSSYGYGSARDWARFGLLYLHDGVWNGERILPEGWVKYSSTPAPAAPLQEYGAQWWLNAGEKLNPAHRRLPDVPTDAFEAEGFEGQHVLVIPSKHLVVVRLGVTHSNGVNFSKFVAAVIRALPD